MNNAFGIATTLSHIIQELELAKDTTTSLENSIAFLKDEIDTKRQSITNGQRLNQKLESSMMQLIDRSSQCTVDILELTSEEALLKHNIEETKQQVIRKRRDLEMLKDKNKAAMQFTESMEKFVSKRSLLVNANDNLSSPTPAIVDESENGDAFEDLTDVDLAAFACSQ